MKSIGTLSIWLTIVFLLMVGIGNVFGQGVGYTQDNLNNAWGNSRTIEAVRAQTIAAATATANQTTIVQPQSQSQSQPRVAAPIPPPLPQAPIIYMFGPGQEPIIQKMPNFAFLQCRPLEKCDKILDVRTYSASGKNIYKKIVDYAREVYLETGWNPAKVKMLVLVLNRNRSFSTSGSVSSSWSQTDSENQIQQMLSKNQTSSLYATGSVAPSFSQSWVSQKFDIHFFLIE